MLNLIERNVCCVNKQHVYYSRMGTSTESKLRAVLNKKGVTPAEFARIARVNSQTVNNWIKRGVPHARLMEVAELLNVAPSELSQNKVSVVGVAEESAQYDEIASAADLFAKYGDQLQKMPIKELMKVVGRIEAIVEKHLKAADKDN